MKKLWNKHKAWIRISIVPIVLLFSYESGITKADRLKYFFETLQISAPFLFAYTMLITWYDNNRLFAVGIGTALCVNLLVGIKYHWIRGTFSIRDLLLKNIEMLIIVFAVYALLMALAIPLSESFVGTMFVSTVEFISILYPVSKAVKNIFIITDGKHPPKFVMEALYNFEKDGKLKDFFDAMNGKGQNADSQTNEEELSN